MLRSNHGCWTCRLRRKKCDEVRPACTTCVSRSITCHGYGEKPEWKDGGEREKQQILTTRKEVQRNLKNRRRQDRLSNSNHEVSPHKPVTDFRVGSATGLLDPDCFTAAQPQLEAGVLNEKTRTMSERITSYREAELIMHYMDHVFPLQFRFHNPDKHGRGWLLWLFVRTGPLYHAALSLSALHQYTYLSNVVGDTYAELAGYHAKALHDLQEFLQHLRLSSDTDDESRLLEVMSCGVSLISFELFQGGVSNWQLHLDALISILTSGSSSSIIQILTKARSINDAQNALCNWKHSALSFLVAVITWFDLLACASTGKAPRMPYCSLLDKDIVDMSKYMGAQNWVMRSIGDIAALDAWKRSIQHDEASKISDLLSRGRAIEECLERGLRKLDKEPVKDRTAKIEKHAERSEKIQNVTRVFATAARVQLRAILLGFGDTLETIKDAVSINVTAMARIKDQQDMRGLVWPICIAGSVAEIMHQPFYEDIVTETLGKSTRDFGNCATILKILRRTWELRQFGHLMSANWRDAMNEIGFCLLV